jgi:hypothetical protein
VLVLGIMARTGRELAIAQSPQLPAQGLLRDREAELLPEPLDQIDQAPAHHAVDRRNRSLFDDGLQGRPLGLVQDRSSTRGLAVDQPGRTLGVEAQHPVTHALQGDATTAGRLRPRLAVVDHGQSQKAADLVGIARLFGQRAQSRRVEIGAKGNRGSHDHPRTDLAATESHPCTEDHPGP